MVDAPTVKADEWVMVPRDDPARPFSDSLLPLDMIEAGENALDKANTDLRNYVSGKTIDWDSGMIVVAVYRAMLSASPPAPMPVVDEGMVDRAITAARGNDDWLRCPAAFKQHLRLEMLRALTAALTPPAIATASEGDKT